MNMQSFKNALAFYKSALVTSKGCSEFDIFISELDAMYKRLSDKVSIDENSLYRLHLEFLLSAHFQLKEAEINDIEILEKSDYIFTNKSAKPSSLTKR